MECFMDSPLHQYCKQGTHTNIDALVVDDSFHIFQAYPCKLWPAIQFSSRKGSARLQVPHDQPKVAQAMIEKWIDGVLKQT